MMIVLLGPHGVFGVAPALQTLCHETMLGDNFHMLVAPSLFLAPVINIWAKQAGFRPCDRSSFKALLSSGRSVGVIPGGIAEVFEAGPW